MWKKSCLTTRPLFHRQLYQLFFLEPCFVTFVRDDQLLLNDLVGAADRALIGSRGAPSWRAPLLPEPFFKQTCWRLNEHIPILLSETRSIYLFTIHTLKFRNMFINAKWIDTGSLLSHNSLMDKRFWGFFFLFLNIFSCWPMSDLKSNHFFYILLIREPGWLRLGLLCKGDCGFFSLLFFAPENIFFLCFQGFSTVIKEGVGGVVHSVVGWRGGGGFSLFPVVWREATAAVSAMWALEGGRCRCPCWKRGWGKALASMNPSCDLSSLSETLE